MLNPGRARDLSKARARCPHPPFPSACWKHRCCVRSKSHPRSACSSCACGSLLLRVPHAASFANWSSMAQRLVLMMDASMGRLAALAAAQACSLDWHAVLLCSLNFKCRAQAAGQTSQVCGNLSPHIVGISSCFRYWCVP